MVLLITESTSGSTTLSTTIEIDLSISVTVKGGSSSGVSSESTSGDSCSNDSNSLDGTSIHSNSNPSTPVKKSERLLAKGQRSSTNENHNLNEGVCMWRECSCVRDTSSNILDHIQTIHVAPQTKAKGYICLWEGCKVYNKKSSSLSWIERHVLSHGGNKPFRCIFPGCGLSFGSQGALERHVNSHITTNGSTPLPTQPPRKLESTPTKHNRRKKIRARKQKINTGQFVDFFDKRSIEVIKYRLARSVSNEQNYHTTTFTSQILSRRTSTTEEPHVLVRWHPLDILPDEWIPEQKYVERRLVPFRQLPPSKLRLLFPSMFPPERLEKASRKWKQRTNQHPLKQEIEESNCEFCNLSSCNCCPMESEWTDLISYN